MQPCVSIITPVYNSISCLKECLEGILLQSYTDWELILVDDGSTDGSSTICDKYAEKDDRIHVLHKNNEGVSLSRNAGLQLAHGRWITFVDSDDRVRPDYLNDLVKNAQSADHVVCSHQTFGAYSERLGVKQDVIHNLNIDAKRIFDISTEGSHENFVYLFCWGHLFRKDIIDRCSLQFNPNLMFGEDTIFVMEYLTQCHTSAQIHNCNYQYRTSREDITRRYPLNLTQLFFHIRAITDAVDRYSAAFSIKKPSIWQNNISLYHRCFRTHLKQQVKKYAKYILRH